jgi:hypothetical protein
LLLVPELGQQAEAYIDNGVPSTLLDPPQRQMALNLLLQSRLPMPPVLLWLQLRVSI